jgi:hypothetical protein
MALLAVVGALSLMLAWSVREWQLSRERRAFAQAVDHLRVSLETTRHHLRKVSEDLFVLQSLMVERNLIDETELARGRMRLIEGPRRAAEERDALAKNMKVSPTVLVLVDSEGDGGHKIH